MRGGMTLDISILLGLQEFRNGAGAFLTDFLSRMTFLFPLCAKALERRQAGAQISGGEERAGWYRGIGF